MPKIIDLPPLIEDITEDDLLIIRNDSDSETQKGTFAQLLSWLQSIWLPKNKYCFRAYAGGATTLTDGQFVKIAVSTESYDYGDNFSGSAYTVPVDGVYHFDAAFRINGAVATGVNALAMIYKNGSAALNGGVYVPVSDGAFAVSGDLYLETGDIIEFYGKQDSAGNEATLTGASLTYFSGHLVHAV